MEKIYDMRPHRSSLKLKTIIINNYRNEDFKTFSNGLIDGRLSN